MVWQTIVQEKLSGQKERNEVVYRLEAELESTKVDLKRTNATLAYRDRELRELEDNVHLVWRTVCGPGVLYIAFLHLVCF